MAKAKVRASAPALPAEPVDPDMVDAREFFELDQWRKSPEVAQRLKKHEELRQRLKGRWKDSQRNAPWEWKGGRVYFVQQQGKSKSVCGLGNCGNIGLKHSPEWHVKAELMQQPPDAA